LDNKAAKLVVAMVVLKKITYIGVRIQSIALLIMIKKMRHKKVNNINKYLKQGTDAARNA
jgi:hypothetical protein